MYAMTLYVALICVGVVLCGIATGSYRLWCKCNDSLDARKRLKYRKLPKPVIKYAR